MDQMGIRSASLLLWIGCLSYVSTPQGAVRLGDATYVYDLGQYESAVTALESEYLSLIDSASGDGRLILYRNYNQLMGTWLQVNFLRTLLDRAVEAESLSDEEEIRSMLRDHGQYLLWELDDAIAGLDERMLETQHPAELRINDGARSLLSNVRVTVKRLLVDHCASALCAVGP